MYDMTSKIWKVFRSHAFFRPGWLTTYDPMIASKIPAINNKKILMCFGYLTIRDDHDLSPCMFQVFSPLFVSGLWTGFGVISLPVFMVMELKYLPPFIHSLIHSLLRSLVHSLVLWFIHTYTHTYIYVHTYINACIIHTHTDTIGISR